MLTLDTVFLLVIIVIVALIWFESLRMRELVIRHCKQLCRETNLQLLDQTVSLISLSLQRTGSGNLGLQRKYQFEVSENGVDRYSGFVTSLGNSIIESRLDGPENQSTFLQSKSKTLH